MAGGTDIDVEGVEGVAETVRSAGKSMADAAAYAVEADPDTYMWGILGMPLSIGYFEATPHIHGMLQHMPDALEGLAKRIEDAAAAASDCDEEAGRSFDELNPAEGG